MTLFHGSYAEINEFKSAPIWCSNSYDTANNYIICQSEGDQGWFGFIYEVEVDERNIIVVEDFVAVDCGSILNEMDGEIFSAENDGGDKIFCIRDASRFQFRKLS